jgi:hypothetical protein
VLAAPLPAMAQAWPTASVLVAGAPPIGSQARISTVVDAAPRSFTVIDERPSPVRRAPATPPTARPAPLQLQSDPDKPETPKVEIRAKAAWLDDQGFRASPTKVSYKLRF